MEYAPIPSPAVPSVGIAAPNPGAKPCMYAANCTRPGCFFSHPVAIGSLGAIPCKFGLGCTRPDCHFSHPPGHRRGPHFTPSHHNQPYGAAIQHKKNMSTTFTSPNGTGTVNGTTVNTGKAGSTVLEGKENVVIDDSKMSARMKKFMEQSAPADLERIIPGSGLTQGVAKTQSKDSVDGDKDDLEVVM